MEKSLELLQKYFKHSEFKGLQKPIIDRIINEKKHSLVLMPTGSGKSVCYQIPALIFDGGTIVISPLIALMQDQVDALKKKGIRAEFINSTVSKKQREERLHKFLDGKIKLLYVTPERFRKREFIEKISEANISLLAIDEAHCISEWGHDFRPDYSRIAEFREMIGNPLTIALTATATTEVQKDIIDKLGVNDDEIKVFHQGIDRPNLRLVAEDVYDNKETINAISHIIKSYPGSGIIYFALIKTLEKYSELLNKMGIEHSVYHGKLDPKIRKITQRKFIDGKDELVLATNAFGMGIDKPDIRFVIHAEMPSSIEAYYQEIGRAGRDGKNSICSLLYNQNDLYTQMEFIKWANPDADYYSRIYEIIRNDIQVVNSGRIEYLREQMSFKDKNDYRVETVLSMLERYNVIEGEIERGTLKLIGELPKQLNDERALNNKLLNDNKKLLAVVNYFKSPLCKRNYISEYFGFPGNKPCGNCDICDKN